MLTNKPFRLSTSYIKRAFQISVELDVKNSTFGTVKYNGSVIYNWAKDKFVNLQLPDNMRTFSKNRFGNEVSVIYDSEKPYFCIKASHPDSKMPIRFWITEAEILVVSNKVLLGVKLSYSIPVSQTENIIDYSVPTFVKEIYKNNGIKDIRELKPKVWELVDEDIDELYDFIQNSNRRLPVVVISQSSYKEGIAEQYYGEYLINGERLAGRVGLIAHVVCLSEKVSQLWNEKVGKNWGVYNGAVRTYFPGINFDDDTYMQHPLSVAKKIVATQYIDENENEYVGSEAFEYVLMNNLRKYNTNMHLEWESIGHKFYFIANREKLINEKEKLLDKMKVVEEDATVYQELMETLEEEYEKKCDDLSAEIQTIQMEKDFFEDEFNRCKQTIYNLKNLVDTLRQKLKSSPEKEQDIIPILDDYTKLGDWINTYFPGKLVLHERAFRLLKRAEYEDPELVFKALKLLGTTYYQMRMGDVTRQEFDQQCAELGIDESESISKTAAGELGDEYFVTYRGSKRKLDRHLRKGVARDARQCMRIYFFWDEEEEVIVIGSLPKHLETSKS